MIRPIVFGSMLAVSIASSARQPPPNRPNPALLAPSGGRAGLAAPHTVPRSTHPHHSSRPGGTPPNMKSQRGYHLSHRAFTAVDSLQTPWGHSQRLAVHDSPPHPSRHIPPSPAKIHTRAGVARGGARSQREGARRRTAGLAAVRSAAALSSLTRRRGVLVSKSTASLRPAADCRGATPDHQNTHHARANWQFKNRRFPRQAEATVLSVRVTRTTKKSAARGSDARHSHPCRNSGAGKHKRSRDGALVRRKTWPSATCCWHRKSRPRQWKNMRSPLPIEVVSAARVGKRDYALSAGLLAARNAASQRNLAAFVSSRSASAFSPPLLTSLRRSSAAAPSPRDLSAFPTPTSCDGD